MWFGWEKLYIDENGFPAENETQWIASCFILFTHVIYVGEIKEA